MWPEVVADIVSDEKDDKDSLNLYFSGVATETDQLVDTSYFKNNRGSSGATITRLTARPGELDQLTFRWSGVS